MNPYLRKKQRRMVTPIISRRPAPGTAPITANGDPVLVDLVSGVSVSANLVSVDSVSVIHVAGEDCPKNGVVVASCSVELVILKSVVTTISGHKHHCIDQLEINIIKCMNLIHFTFFTILI